MLVNCNSVLQAPDMARPLTSHWYVSGGEPAALTVKSADPPTKAVRLCGEDVMVGSPKTVTTVSMAAALVRTPHPVLVKTTR